MYISITLHELRYLGSFSALDIADALYKFINACTYVSMYVCSVDRWRSPDVQ